jgi:CheY-like chemotaxis protein
VDSTPEAPLNILVVDDDHEVAAVLVDILGLDGHDVDVAPNGLAALERLRTGAYDLIVSDLRMPELTGGELYRRLEDAGDPRVRRFVFITGDVLAPEASDFLERTGAPSLAKPFVIDDVQDVIRRARERAGEP